MNKIMLAILPAAVLIAGGATMPDAEAPDAADFIPIQRYAIEYSEPEDVVAFYVRNSQFDPRAAKIRYVEGAEAGVTRVALATIDGLKDDSVQAVQWRIGLRFEEGLWSAAQAGVRRMCRRGENAGEWTTDECP